MFSLLLSPFLQVECALFRLLTLERMLGTKLVWSKAGGGGRGRGQSSSEENIARYTRARKRRLRSRSPASVSRSCQSSRCR